ncbi:unnamed protein product, partial [Rotaria socialis]
QTQPQSVLKVPTINAPSPATTTTGATKRTSHIIGRKSTGDPEVEYNDHQGNEFEHDEIRAINEHVHEYYYAVRVLPGQNLRSVYIGWVASRFKPILQYENLVDDTTTSANKLA